MSYLGLHSLGAAQAGHPLAAIRRIGVVTDTSLLLSTPPTIQVAIGGDTDNPCDVAYLSSYISPTVGDVVMLIDAAGDFAAIGAIGPNYYEEWTLGTQTATSGTEISVHGSTRTKLTGTTSAFTSSTGRWICPGDGAYLVSYMCNIGLSAATLSRILFTLSSGSLAAGTIFSRDDKGNGPAYSCATSMMLMKYFTAGTTVYANAFSSITDITTVSGQISFRAV